MLDPIFADPHDGRMARSLPRRAGPVRPGAHPVSEAVAQEQVKHSGFVTTVEHPTLGDIPQLQPRDRAERDARGDRRATAAARPAQRRGARPRSDTARRRSTG